MPVTIEPVAKENARDPLAPVTFAKYSETLRLFHAEFIRIAVQYGRDKPSATLPRSPWNSPSGATARSPRRRSART